MSTISKSCAYSYPLLEPTGALGSSRKQPFHCAAPLNQKPNLGSVVSSLRGSTMRNRPSRNTKQNTKEVREVAHQILPNVFRT